MYRSRVSYGSMAASAAMVCVLSLVPSVVSPIGGFFALPLAHAQCCSAPDSPTPITSGAEPPVARFDPVERAARTMGRSGRTRGIINYTAQDGRPATFDIYRQTPPFSATDSTGKTGAWYLQDWGLQRLEGARDAPHVSVASLVPGIGGTIAHRDFGGGSDMAVATDTTVVDETPAPNDDTANSRTAGKTGGESASADDGEFSGSAAQSGPNLSTSEEKDIIVKGWK